MSNVIEANGSLSQWVNSFEKRLVVIDFFATWCGPCRMMHPLFDQMSLKYTNVVFIRVDSDQNRDLAGQYGVSGLPTFVLVIHGDEVDRVVGADPNALESKIQQYANSAATFKGTGMSLGGSGARDAQSIREMRLKNFKDVKIHGSQMAGKVSKMLDRVKSDSDEEVASESNSEMDAGLRDNLLTMGFSASNVDKTLKECKSRDIADLVAYITTLPEVAEGVEPAEQSSHPEVVCDGNECHFVNRQPEKSFDERMEETRKRIQQKKLEKEEAEKKAAIQREKERIERGKAMQSTKEEFEAMQRKRELERQRQEKIAEENEKKRQLELWRAEHGLPAVQQEKVVEKTPEEKAKLLAESVALQRIDNVGINALRTLQVILNNTAKEDPKYRQLRKDNGVLQRKVASVPGALPLMMMAGFELDGDVYVMKNRDSTKVNVVLAAIAKCLYCVS